MNAQEVNQSFDLLDYVGKLVQLHKSGPYFIGPCPMCGGRDRFNLKRNGKDLWVCRQCSPGKYQSAIDFVMKYHNIEFKEALTRMGGDVESLRRELGNGRKIQAPAPVQVLPAQEWQAKTWEIVEAANDRLLNVEDEGAYQAFQYLRARGIHKGSVYRGWLGFDMCYGRPAITIPYIDLGDVITAVKLRFIDNGKQRYSALEGSMLSNSLFGLQHIRDTDHTLLFVEGEINQISILQMEPAGVSVISAGSESNGNAAILRGLARQYDRVIVWADKAGKAKETAAKMGRPDAALIQSPMIGNKKDANQMLQDGTLMEFIAAKLKTVCYGVPVEAESERAVI